MEQLINQYSFLWIAGALVLLLALFLFRRQPKTGNWIALIALAAGLFVAWLFLRPTQTPLMGDAQQVQSMIGAGMPVLLEFQSPYWLACTRIKPVVDGLENELGDKIRVIRLNVQEPAGRELAPLYDFRFTPTFIFFDADGDELWREVGSLDPARVRESVE